MADKSNIEWTDASWTPIRARNKATGKIGWYCEHATTGCEFCYAEGMNRRFGTGVDFKRQNRERVEIFLDEKMLVAPLRWKKPRMIFVCSMTDLFAEFVKDEWIDKLFAVMALCPQHTFQVLTKRPERMRDYVVGLNDRHTCDGNLHLDPQVALLAAHIERGAKLTPDMVSLSARTPWPLPNVWLGVSCERQQEADERIPLLLQTPAAVRFISAEPLLGAINLRIIPIGLHHEAMGFPADHDYFDALHALARRRLDWVIVGGESGRNARPIHPDWARRLRDQCKVAGVKFFFKQWGNYVPADESASETQEDEELRNAAVMIDGQYMRRVGKKSAGRLLDGREHNEFPSVV